MGSLSSTDRVAFVAGAEIVGTGEASFFLRGLRGTSTLGGVPRDALASVIEAVRRGGTVGSIVDAGASMEVVEALVACGVLERVPTPLPMRPITIAGSGRLADAIARALPTAARIAASAGSWLGADRLAEHARRSLLGAPLFDGVSPLEAIAALPAGSVLVLALEGEPYDVILRAQRAAAEVGASVLVASVERDAVVIDPVHVGGATACFACVRARSTFGPNATREELVDLFPFLRTSALGEDEAAAIAGATAAVVPIARDPSIALARGVSLARRTGAPRSFEAAPRAACPHCSPASPRGDEALQRHAAVALTVAADVAAAHARPMPRRAENEPYKRVGIVGGGTAGFLTALTLRRKRPDLEVTLIESSRIPILGVGEATTPFLVHYLHDRLGLPVDDLYRRVLPTWKVGISFFWGKPGDYAFQFPFQFGSVAEPLAYRGDIESYCLGSLLQEQKRVPIVACGDGRYLDLRGEVPIAYHLDNRRFVKYLREEAIRAGVTILDRDIGEIALTERGDEVKHLVTTSGEQLDYDLYVDCTGFRALLLERLGSRFVSYASSLFDDSAVMGNIPNPDGTIKPYTLAETMDSGWCWNIPFEDADHRGYVFSSAFASVDDAMKEITRKNPGISDLWSLKFRSGRHEDFFLGNVVALGNSYAFVEPLESTAIHMLLVALSLLTDHFPRSRGDLATKRMLSTRLNALWDELRGFLAIHFRFNGKLDTPYWRECRTSTALGTGAARVALFEERAPLMASAGLFRNVDPFFDEFGRRDFFSQEYVYDILLAGQTLPRQAGEPSMSRAEWEARIARMKEVGKHALPMREALAVLRERPESVIRPGS